MPTEWASEFRVRFGQILVDNGLLPRARRWYRDGEELVAIVELQQSQFGDLFYVNVALSIPDLDGLGRISPNNSALRLRLETFIPLDSQRYRRALSGASGMDDDERFVVLRKVITEHLMPRLSNFTKVSDLKAALESDMLWRAHSGVKTRRYLGVDELR